MTSSFVVATADLARHPGARQHVVRTGPVRNLALSASRLGTEDVTVDVVLEAQGATVTVTGTVAGQWTGECRRCLEATGGELVAPLSEVFEPDPVEGETYPLARDHVDLEPAVREALALALPLAPLCDEACAGPDPGDYPVTVEPDEDGPVDEPDHGGEPPRDPRWAALDQLRFDA
ncbi:MAG TPA: YceD family protein [Acidimicrobiales bacterium]